MAPMAVYSYGEYLGEGFGERWSPGNPVLTRNPPLRFPPAPPMPPLPSSATLHELQQSGANQDPGAIANADTDTGVANNRKAWYSALAKAIGNVYHLNP